MFRQLSFFSVLLVSERFGVVSISVLEFTPCKSDVVRFVTVAFLYCSFILYDSAGQTFSIEGAVAFLSAVAFFPLRRLLFLIDAGIARFYYRANIFHTAV